MFSTSPSAQTSAQYSYAYKTQASAIGRLLWMGNPPHAEQLVKTHAKLSALGSKMYEPIEIKGKDKQARLESAGDQIAAFQDEIGAAIESCEDYVKLKFGWGKKKKAAKVLVEETTQLRLYGDRIEVGDEARPLYTFSFDEAGTVTVLGKNKINLYIGDKLYQFWGSERFNALRYVNIFYRWQNCREGAEHGKFLGL